MELRNDATETVNDSNENVSVFSVHFTDYYPNIATATTTTFSYYFVR